ncbi:hypothetical protein BC831DRAFT_274868 [Entophlyctis helioformis]|nr:hypothetical protein BC831DRAFT_274868 [Entophlyctis helioformis]
MSDQQQLPPPPPQPPLQGQVQPLEAQYLQQLQQQQQYQQQQQQMALQQQQQRLDQVYLYFGKALTSVPWSINDRVSAHLSADILEFLVFKWPSMASQPGFRAGFLLAILASPKKRISSDLKQVSEKLVELGLQDEDEYVRILAAAVSKWVSHGYFGSDEVLDNSPVFAPVLEAMRQSLGSHRFAPREIAYLGHNVRRSLQVREPSTPGASSSSHTPAFQFKDEHAILPLEERIASYGMVQSPRRNSMPRFGSTPTSATSATSATFSGALGGMGGAGQSPGGLSKTDSTASLLALSPASAQAGSVRKKAPTPFLRQKSQLAVTPIGRRTSLTGPSSARADGTLSGFGPMIGRGFRKESKIKILHIEEAIDIDKSKTDAQRKIEDDAKAEKDRKQREKDAEIQARKDAKEHEAEEKRLKKIRLEEERKAKAEAREAKEREREERKQRHLQALEEHNAAKRPRLSSADMGSPTSPSAMSPSGAFPPFSPQHMYQQPLPHLPPHPDHFAGFPPNMPSFPPLP